MFDLGTAGPRRAGLALLLCVSLFAPERLAAGQSEEASTPTPRSGFSLVFDTARDRVVLFGGSGPHDTGPERLGDTWELDGGAWHRIDAPGPPARYDAQAAFDSGRGVLVLFGGGTESGRAGDTWEYDGERWRQAAEEGPPARSLGAMAYDAARRRTVLFGGSGADRSRLGDTWEWDGVAWSLAHPGGGDAPSGRGSHALAYSPTLRRVLLYGGWDGEATRGDLWAWDGDRWSALSDEGPPRLHAAVDFVPDRNGLVVFGGFGAAGREASTWIWREGGWSRLDVGAGPDARAEHEGVFAGRRGFVVFGGVTGQGMAVEDRRKVADTWALAPEGWERLAGAGHEGR